MILQKKSGQSLIEILVAIGVGVIMLVGAVTALTPAIKSLADVSKTQGAASVSKELLDNLRIFADANWHNIDTLSTSTKYFLNTATSTFTVATGTEGIIADGITSGLVGYWKLDDNTATTTMDFSGNRNDGVKSGTGATATSSCPISGCLYFGGSSYIQVNDPADGSLDFATSSFTLGVWINSATSTGARIIMGKRVYPPGFVLYTSGGNLNLQVNDASPHSYAIGSYNYIDSWHHIFVVVDRTSNVANYYLDGNLISSPAIAAGIGSISNAGFFGIGRDQSDAASVFVGKIDDVRIYNRALTAAEISTIYRANIFTRSFQVSDVYRDSNDSDKIIDGTSGSYDPSTKKITIEYGWPGAQLKNFSAYFTRYRNKSFVQTSWQAGPSSAYTTTTASWFTTSSNINYSTSTGIRILGL